MDRYGLVREAAARANFSQDVMLRALKSLLSVIVDQVAAGGEIRISGFGRFYRSFRAPRTGRNNHTGETVPIPAQYKPMFKPSNDFVATVVEESADEIG